MGRCPVRAIFPEALQLLAKKQEQVGYDSQFHSPRRGSQYEAYLLTQTASCLTRLCR